MIPVRMIQHHDDRVRKKKSFYSYIPRSLFSLFPVIFTHLLLNLLLHIPSISNGWSYERSHLQGYPSILSDWYTSCISIHLDQRGSQRLDLDDFERVAQASLEAWEVEYCSNLSLELQGWTQDRLIGYDVEPNAVNQNVILFQSQSDEWLYDSRVVGLTTLTMCQNNTTGCQAGTIIDGDIELNEVDFEFTVNDQMILVDLQNVLTHEIGHLVGFDHTSDGQSTMYAATPIGEIIKRDLSSDDQQGICDVYPLESNEAQLKLGCLDGPYLFGGPSQRGLDQHNTDMGIENSAESTHTSSGCHQTRQTLSLFPTAFLSLLTLLMSLYLIRRSLNEDQTV